MAMVTTRASVNPTGVIQQCDVFRDVEYLEYALEVDGVVEFSKIHFPYAIVLTQACDLQQDHDAKEQARVNPGKNQDKYLLSVIVAPLYNSNDFFQGKHLEQLGFTMRQFPSKKRTETKDIYRNENKRYHFLSFDNDIPVVDSVIDFKHYFSVSVGYLTSIYAKQYVCSIDDLYRESISHRFSHFLSRIGLPEPE